MTDGQTNVNRKAAAPNKWDNIEVVARAICAKELAEAPNIDIGECEKLVDRFWSPVAAQLAAGLRDENGRLIPHSPAAGIEAWEAWLDDNRKPNAQAEKAAGV
jgi:hypothetical protein